LTRKAQAGDADAQNEVGSELKQQKRYAEALAWFEKAAAQGHAMGIHNLAFLYDAGLGVAQDRSKAYELYLRSAELGWPDAMWNIANMHGAGQVGPRDLMSACVWTFRARRFAGVYDEEVLARSSRVLPFLRANLTAAELDTCRAQADKWEPKGKANR
jgi:uncharacterized protein